MDFVLTASIIASFMAGIVALFAPCCISILLPTYLASVFKRKTKVLQMTFVYFAGIATILIPVGLGAAAVAQVFQNFHIELYILGGFMMVIFGVMSFAGKGMAILPKSLQAGQGGFSGKSVFALGIFSGAATSCCAPVLAGTITLAVLSGTFLNALIVIFAYVFGMTMPLFILALFWEKFDIQNSRLVKGKLFEFQFGAKKFYIHSTNLMAGILFLGIGMMLIGLALSGNTFWAPETQVYAGEYLTKLSAKIVDLLQVIPNYAWGSAIILFFAYLIKVSLKRKKQNNGSKRDNNYKNETIE